MLFPKHLGEKIKKRKEDGTIRNLIDLDNLVDFYSNDYLGASRISFNSLKLYGSSGSRLISGNSNYIEKVEQRIANFFNSEAGLFFTSGFDGNLGIFSSIASRHDTILMDSLCHASIRDGAMLSNANKHTFKHNDLNHLEEKLKVAKGTVYVAVESVYSMDGDISPLEKISKLCNSYKAYLIVDEAHSGGTIGKYGQGLVSDLNLDNSVFIKLITFGKAFGSSGAIVLCSEQMREYLINFSRPFIYSTGIAPNHIERIEKIVESVAKMEIERKLLIENIAYFKKIAKENKLETTNSITPIQAIFIPGIKRLKNKTEELNIAGYAVRGISEPTVPSGTERIRICLHSYNTKKEIKELLSHF